MRGAIAPCYAQAAATLEAIKPHRAESGYVPYFPRPYHVSVRRCEATENGEPIPRLSQWEQFARESLEAPEETVKKDDSS
ncbi:uncharacterized protein SPSK_00638 [Sporothrix schenckii 1099-18]|uniref:Uncharacterized protein n=1 Tax=Sporothrix schenckii 1099-18 TaxID=1397361 RepID=A0A0F2LR60_SPOSC|nr:uncharacterized protein SPSK_00638 [Sporothrix schenckii 1099-18]KJR79992.1 hypothetical protein SPSK_00638 [Sporothrix schenckii 1099-18]